MSRITPTKFLVGITNVNNTLLGIGAIRTRGIQNTFVGVNAGLVNTGNGSVFLGFNAGLLETGSNKLYIANTNTTTPLIGGDFTSGVTINKVAIPTSMLDLNGSFARPLASIVTVAPGGTLILGNLDYYIEIDVTLGSTTVALPIANSCKGRSYSIKKVDASANTITIDGDGAETIDGVLTKVLNVQWQSVSVTSDGSNSWLIFD
jgi:hypothetical protein